MLGVDYVQVMFGENARQAAGWLYVQEQGDGIVSFVGASKMPDPHPLRWGSSRTHQFAVGEIIVRPRLVVATDALRGEGIGNLLTGDHNIEHMLSRGEVLLGTQG